MNEDRLKELKSWCLDTASLSNDPKRKVGVIAFLDDKTIINWSYNYIFCNKQNHENKNFYSLHAEINLIDSLNKCHRNRHNDLNIMINYFTCSSCALAIGVSNFFKKIYTPDWRKEFNSKWESNWRASEEILKHFGIEIEYIEF